MVEAETKDAISRGMRGFSSGVGFWGWRELEGKPTLFKPPPKYQALFVWLPKTWLLRESWTRHGLVSTHDVPGPHR
jgi:hypothetical protein